MAEQQRVKLTDVQAAVDAAVEEARLAADKATEARDRLRADQSDQDMRQHVESRMAKMVLTPINKALASLAEARTGLEELQRRFGGGGKAPT